MTLTKVLESASSDRQNDKGFGPIQLLFNVKQKQSYEIIK